MPKLRNTQWHPAFCSAIKLELAADKRYLEYMNEYNLTSKPLQMDLLIIKKIRNHQIKNEIGKIFRIHNILEYKSPEDKLNVNTYLKVIAYACLYKISEKRFDEIKLQDITLTFIREKFPYKLVKWLRKNGYEVVEQYKGIYYVVKPNTFLTQIIVSKRLSKENQKWITLLSQNLDEADAERAIAQTNGLIEKDEKDYADSVLQVAVAENEQVFHGVKEVEGNMCEALRKLMEPEFNEMKAAAIAEGRAEGRAEAEAEMQRVIEAIRQENELLKEQIRELLQNGKALA